MDNGCGSPSAGYNIVTFYIVRKMERSSFVFYNSFHTAAKFLDREEKLLIYEMIIEY